MFLIYFKIIKPVCYVVVGLGNFGLSHVDDGLHLLFGPCLRTKSNLENKSGEIVIVLVDIISTLIWAKYHSQRN